MKEISAIVAGTGFDNRANIIRSHCKKNSQITLRREANNPHDANAIAVYLHITSLFGLIKTMRQIGYIKAKRAANLSAKLDSGEIQIINCFVTSFYAPENEACPRVSLTLNIIP